MWVWTTSGALSLLDGFCLFNRFFGRQYGQGQPIVPPSDEDVPVNVDIVVKAIRDALSSR